MKMLKVPNAPLKSPDVQLFERNDFSSKQTVCLISPKTAGRTDIAMSIEPTVLEAPTGIAADPSTSQSKRHAQNGMQVLRFCLRVLLSAGIKNPIIFQGESEIGNTYQLGTKEA